MSWISLRDYQIDAVKRMKNGCILCGKVGSGKSRTAIAYYYSQNGGDLYSDEYVPMDDPPKNLYIITTARKRDDMEWEGELQPFLLSIKSDINLYSNKIIVDSWNNISKYVSVKESFFIFDEQRVVGSGQWVKSFLKITKKNEWVLLSATPGDKWEDYIPVFIANGFYKNRREFKDRHMIINWVNGKFPKVERYLGTKRLNQLRDSILVDMDFQRETISHHEDVYVKYDAQLYKMVMKKRWNVFTNEPIKNISELCFVKRKIVNSDPSRQIALLEIYEDHPKMIIFYNFDYELDILRNLFIRIPNVEVAEWNGHKHEPLPKGPAWVYLVQYTAGAEGWNCTSTDTMVFYSQNYSYKTMQQAAGRIDRMNTSYKNLFYYHLKSRSSIDLAISNALKNKKKFNERAFCKHIKWN